MNEQETVGGIIDADFAEMVEDWRGIVEQWEGIERELGYLKNSLDEFWSNWLAPLNDRDRAGVFDDNAPRLLGDGN